MTLALAPALARLPLVAILRGLRPDAAREIGEVLLAGGFTALEVPLNRPEALRSIERMAAACGTRAAIGAGTVLSASQVRAVRDAGGSFVVTPDTNTAIIEAALDAGLTPLPGFATPTEAFRALAAGARHLKLFPAGTFGPAYLGALRAVLPAEAAVLAVGGVNAGAMSAWLAAGAAGFGLGTALYTPEFDRAKIAARAVRLVNAYEAARTGQ